MKFNFINDHIKKLFCNFDDLPHVERLTKDLFGIDPEITIISRNRTYLLDLNGEKIKARFVPSENYIHELIQDECNVPKVIGRIKFNESVDLKFSEWIDGFTYKKQLSDATVYDHVSPNYYYQMGSLLAKIGNIKAPCGRYIGMSDVYWLNFLIKEKEDQVYLTDLSKLYLTDFPEFFIFTQVIFHEYTPMKCKESFVAGYHEFHKKRPADDRMIIMQKMIEGML